MSSFGERGPVEKSPQLASIQPDEREASGSVESVEIAPLVFEINKYEDRVVALFECASPEACVAYKEAIGYAFDRLNWQRGQEGMSHASPAFRVGTGFQPHNFARPGKASIEIMIAGDGGVTEDEANRVLEDIKRDVKFIQPSYQETQEKQEEERVSILFDDAREPSPDSGTRVLVTEPGGIMRDKWRYIFIGAKGRQRQLYLWAMGDVFGPVYNPRPRMGTAMENPENATLTEPLVWELDKGPYSRAFALERLEDVHKAVREMEGAEKKR